MPQGPLEKPSGSTAWFLSFGTTIAIFGGMLPRWSRQTFKDGRQMDKIPLCILQNIVLSVALLITFYLKGK